MTNDAFFEVTESELPGVPVLDVGGEIDVATSPRLQELLTGLIEGGSTFVIVNLTDVSFIDSTGLGALAAGVKEARAAGGDIRLVVTSPQIIKLLELTGLDEVFSVASSTKDAVGS
jgi:anti-sigma B factor antagonist